MTSGRWIVVIIIGVTALFGAGMWYAQTRAYYQVVDAVALSVTTPEGDLQPLDHGDFRGIDAPTSPLRFRACFTLDAAGLAVVETAAAATDPEPLVAPSWFDCYDARTIAEALVDGTARAILSEHEIARGVDRVFAVFPDGRAYGWHQLNGTLEE